jgi:hypothetical protein
MVSVVLSSSRTPSISSLSSHQGFKQTIQTPLFASTSSSSSTESLNNDDDGKRHGCMSLGELTEFLTENATVTGNRLMVKRKDNLKEKSQECVTSRC